MRLDLSSFNKCASGRADLEETSVEWMRKGKWGIEQDQDSFSEATLFQVSEDCGGGGFGTGGFGSGAQVLTGKKPIEYRGRRHTH
ncbi:unnamed protein product, partial [Citrullus colocynthis]